MTPSDAIRWFRVLYWLGVVVLVLGLASGGMLVADWAGGGQPRSSFGSIMSILLGIFMMWQSRRSTRTMYKRLSEG